jgi:hypothetical protein
LPCDQHVAGCRDLLSAPVGQRRDLTTGGQRSDREKSVDVDLLAMT